MGLQVRHVYNFLVSSNEDKWEAKCISSPVRLKRFTSNAIFRFSYFLDIFVSFHAPKNLVFDIFLEFLQKHFASLKCMFMFSSFKNKKRRRREQLPSDFSTRRLSEPSPESVLSNDQNQITKQEIKEFPYYDLFALKSSAGTTSIYLTSIFLCTPFMYAARQRQHPAVQLTKFIGFQMKHIFH